MTDQYKLIDDLHEELETVHEGLGQYDGIELKNDTRPDHSSLKKEPAKNTAIF